VTCARREGSSTLKKLPYDLALLRVIAQSPIRQFMLNGGRDKKTDIAKPLSNNGNRVNDIIQAGGEIEKHVGVNGDELGAEKPAHNRNRS
jgi:hypothetical protein